MSFFFIFMADPQFGCYSFLSGMDEHQLQTMRLDGYNIEWMPKTTGWAKETELYEKAITQVNRLKPAFVVVGGDMINDADIPAQYNELMRITSKLDDGIPVHWVAGNHDVMDDLNPETLGLYRQWFGPDNYVIDYEESRFVVINSNTCVNSSKVSEEWDRLLEFLETAFREASANCSRHIVVFSHHPLFVDRFHEVGSDQVVSDDRRRVLFRLFAHYGATINMASHWHKNVYAIHDGIVSVISGSVGMPLGYDPSGFRIVKVYPDRVEHEYYGLNAMPTRVVV